MELDPCPCGSARTYHKGVAVCSSHCDIPHEPQVGMCRKCWQYQAAVNLRITAEWERERKAGNG